MIPKPSERAAIISFALVFLCGCVLGAVTMTFWLHPNLHRPPASGMNMSVKEWTQELDLTPEQTRQLTSILADFGHYYDNLLADGNSRVLQILTPEQRRRFERMMQEHRKQ